MALHRRHKGSGKVDAGGEMKQCTKCLNILPLELFPPDIRSPGGKQARCRKCINQWMKEHYRNNPAEHMIRRAKGRAKKKGLGFNITLNDITPLPTHCPIFHIPLRVSEVYQDPNTYSLDRIDNTKGYVKGNVAVMSYLANRLKNNGTASQHEQIATWMRSNTQIKE